MRIAGVLVNDAALASAYVFTIVTALALAFVASCWPRVGRVVFGRYTVATAPRPNR